MFSFLSLPRSCKMLSNTPACDSTSQVWPGCFRGVNGGKASGKWSAPHPPTYYFHYNCHPVTQPHPNNGWSYAANSTHNLGAVWYQYNDIGHWFYTSKPAKGRDQSQQTSQDVSHWFLSLVYYFEEQCISQIFVFWVVPWVSSLLAHRSQSSQSSQQPNENFSQQGQNDSLTSWKATTQGLGTIWPYDLGAQKDCSAPVGYDPLVRFLCPGSVSWSVCWWTLTTLND